MSQGFKHCKSAYLQTLYSQVEQQLCTEAILDTLDSIQSRSHGARHHERSLWTNLKDILDARVALASDQELLAKGRVPKKQCKSVVFDQTGLTPPLCLIVVFLS